MAKCSVCKKSNTEVYLTGVQSVYSSKPYNIYSCKNCGHYFTNPVPSTKELGNIYETSYAYGIHALIDPEKKQRASKYAQYISDQGAKNALEIGCMHGLLLTQLEKRGVKAKGVELDPEAVEFCKNLGLDVENTTLEKYMNKSAAKKHDAVIMSHVLEHIAEPRKQVEHLNKKLSKNGMLVLIVPNSQARTRKLFGKYWGYWQTPVHLHHFNDKSITHLLENTGFKVDDIKYVGADSLFFLSSLANRLGLKNTSNDVSLFKKVAVKSASFVLRPWYYLGSEDMIVVARKV